ncbi:hypothetical protein [Nitrosomonas oligotropha]|uniref:hypothetical protein n=1 Tax=Nitrosomonas oligotropha TaxID=42354 RepID=UPI00136BC558|nr:hypothetical protein [Nitrosomonas oligotropha]
MNMSHDQDQDHKRLAQAENLQLLTRELKLTDILTVHTSNTDGSPNYCGIYCALVPNDQIDQALSSSNWDLLHGQGLPDDAIYNIHDKEQYRYLRYGKESGIEPLVIDRFFHDLRDSYNEISEEFRLFHNLYHDRKTNQFIKFDNDGNETVVAIIKEDCIKIRVKEIRQFLAIKNMHLSIQFDCREHSLFSLEELSLKACGEYQRKDLSCWSLNYGDGICISEHRSFSRLFGKRMVEPLPKSKSDFGSFAQETEKEYVEFIINENENGDVLTHTSNPDKLANNFGANPGSPNFLTLIHFRKQVLDKYYQQPSKYLIEDSMLSCGNLWSLKIDNHHSDKICVWLGDLGNISYQEQLYWRTYNIPPQGTVSETYFKREMLAQFTDSKRPEHKFANKYHRLQEESVNRLGWEILLHLDEGDDYYIKGLRIPATEEQRDFDELVLGLTKLLIDSINEKDLKKIIPKEDLPNIKGSINRLEYVLKARGVEEYDSQIMFLRNLQSLRSSGAAHRKGDTYRKIAVVFGVDDQNLVTVFAGIMDQALSFLDFLLNIVGGGKLQGANNVLNENNEKR